MSSDVQVSPQSEASPQDVRQSAPDMASERARKRQAIGLTPQRPTAKEQVYRPPDASSSGGGGLLWIGLVLLLLAILALAWNAMQGRPLDNLLGPSAATGPASEPSETPILADDFQEPSPALAQGEEPGKWSLAFADGRYRIQIQRPGTLTWSTLGMVGLGPHRLEAAVRVDPQTPWGYGGLLVRYQNPENFYLFVADGQGAFQVQLLQDGAWQTLAPWTTSRLLEREGAFNRLAVEDDGRRLRFLVDGQALFTVEKVRLPPGDVGLAGGARSQGEAIIEFDWVRLHPIPLAQP